MSITLHTFWFYTFAVCFLAWGALGVRFSISILAANSFLALLLFPAREIIDDNILHALIFCYPLFWGAAFGLLYKLEGFQLPFPGTVARFFLGLLAALSILCIANRPGLEFSGRMFYAAFIADTNTRPALIRQTLAHATPHQVCRESHANLMTLAMDADDGEVVRALIENFRICPTASRTMQTVVKPLVDKGDNKKISFLLGNGLKPSSLIFGADYANGSALAYAATASTHPDIVTLIGKHDPKDARSMKYFTMMLEALRTQQNAPMLQALRQAGLDS